MNPITEDMLVDYLAGELSPDERSRVSAALARDPALATQLADLNGLLDDVRELPDPELPADADARFAAMLSQAESSVGRLSPGHSPGMPSGGWKSARSSHPPDGTRELRPRATARRRLLRRLSAAAAVLLIFVAGYGLGVNRDADQLAASRTLMLELMDNPRPSERIRATTVTLDMERADAGVLRDLGYLLRNDESANVRLAALDALRRFSGDPKVNDILLDAVTSDPPEVVRFELIETLVRLNETRLLPYLEDIMDADSLPQPVRDAAQLASFKLI